MPAKKKVKRKTTTRRVKEEKNWFMRFIGLFVGISAVLTLSLVLMSPNEHVSRIASSTDLGTFTGVLPCADCEGLKTSITFNLSTNEKNPHTYSETDVYMGKNVINSSSGSWKYTTNPADKKAIILELMDSENPENKQYYLVVDDSTIEMLNQDKQKITDSPIPLVLTKQN